MKDEIGKRQFYLTPSHPCSYLPGRQAQTLFLDPRDTIHPGLYQGLTEHGFRRSGGHLYRPHCQDCQACIPTRIPVAG
ncbi:MAG: arginyltransferase, partial [Pseudomonadota bacterium]